jgi:hypothetical protein
MLKVREVGTGFRVCVTTANLHSGLQNDPWVPHISLVFREMWDTTNVDHSPLENESKA